MRNPGLMVVCTLLNWIAFAAFLLSPFIWPWNNYGMTSLQAFGLVLLLIGALLQTFFLVRNMRISFPSASGTQSANKAKRGTPTRAADFVDSLNEDERAQLLDWMLDQTEEERRSAR